jgi:hypothetical protein
VGRVGCSSGTDYAVLVGWANGDGAWRGLVAIVELIDPRAYMFQSAVYGRLIYTVTYMRDRLLTQANPNPRLPPPPDLRKRYRNRYDKVPESVHRNELCSFAPSSSRGLATTYFQGFGSTLIF